jgi:ribonuclease HI
MYFDGSKSVQGAGARLVLISPQGDKLKYVLRMSFSQASNNEAEYEALLHGIKMANACGATRLKIFGDSNLVVQQVTETFITTWKEPFMDAKFHISARQVTRKPII